MTIITELAEAEAASAALKSSLSAIKWRLKPYAKRRLHTDVLGLCTGMRPVVMVDYGGKMPELQVRLCAFISHAQKESVIFQQLRVMVVEDMIYLVNIDEFAEYIRWSLSSAAKQVFVDLEQDPLKIVTEASGNSVAIQLISVQKLFSSIFSGSGVNYKALQHHLSSSVDEEANASSSGLVEAIDLSSCLRDSPVTIPTLNGWLLYYPVVYLFGKDHIPDAVHNLSNKPLHIFKVLVCRNVGGNDQSQLEELMSYAVPCDLSKEGRNEPWSVDFWQRMQAKWERCKHVWRSLRLEVTVCNPHVVVL